MSLSSGSRIGPYEIISPLGAGGMGEVYRARDTKLDREVAIKVLPVLLAADPERRARFRREAHLLASLNHPHIGSIYGVAEADGHEALVLELIEGPTLADRLAQGRIALEEALTIARQVAEAIEAAHDQGIVHRDLKPANIKLRPDGTVKVLDFGLAKALDPTSSPDAGRIDSPTITTRGTHPGVFLGTAAYMAPEQAQGKTVDKRADIWAFGVVLYEMLASRRAFDGGSTTEVLAGVLTRSPDWNALPAATPPGIRRLLRRCLQKDPRRRIRDIADAAIEIDDTLAGPTDDDPASAAARSRATSRWSLALGVTALVSIALAAIALPRFITPAVTSSGIARFTLALPPGQVMGSLSEPVIDISPDGRRVAYANRWIYVREMNQLETRRVATPSPVSTVFFSRDGQWLGYISTGQLWKVPVTGGTPQVLVTADVSGASWTEADSIVYAVADKGLFRVAAAGGTPELLFPVEPPALVARPQVLPGGRHVLYTEGQSGAWGQTNAVIRALDGGDRQVVLRNAPAARYVETGHIVYGVSGRLMAVPFDLDARRVTGDPIPLPEQVNTSFSTGVWQAAWSRTGTLVHVPPIQSLVQLTWVDRHGRSTPAFPTLRQYSDPRLSPDGRHLATHLQDEENDVWVGDLVRGTLTRVTFDSMEDETPVWSRDGRHVVYSAIRAGQVRGIYRRAADGSGPEELLWKSAEHSHVIDWSPDGAALIIQVIKPATGSDLVSLDAVARRTRPLFQSRFNERYGRLSPNGRWIAYSSDESGREEIYVQPFPALDARVQVSTEGGTQPIWSRDGRELFYRGTRDVLSSALTSEAPLAFETPRALFADQFARPQPDGHITYDVAPDGRFLMIASPRREESAGGGNKLHITLNWFDELKTRGPR